MWDQTMWIGVPGEELRRKGAAGSDINGRFAYYRYRFRLDRRGTLKIKITADSRYRLWVNGEPVNSGPCKGDRYRHYFDELELSELLVCGDNVLAVQVLYVNPALSERQSDSRASLFSVMPSAGYHRLAVHGAVADEDGRKLLELSTGLADWRVYLEHTYYLKAGTKETLNLGAVIEEADMNQAAHGWKAAEYDDGSWEKAEKLSKVEHEEYERKVGLYAADLLRERPIPLLYEERDFLEFPAEEHREPGGKAYIVIRAGQKKRIVLDPGAYTNAYVSFQFAKGRGSRVNITYSEKYSNENNPKLCRTDSVRGELKGITDTVILSGETLVFEPFWVRSFRFIQLEILGGEEDTIVYKTEMRRTGYPLEVQTVVHSESAPWIDSLWEICVRTLRCCMLETYMDCPFYEQMQFVMDTRLQALFTYLVSGDTRLAEKALEDFHCSMMPDGLTQGKYPSAYPQIISTFSFHYIYMLEEYYRQTGNAEMIWRYRTDVDSILEYYDRKIGRYGLAENIEYWPFVDWQAPWKESMGTPAAALKGPSAIINLMYAYALESGAVIFEETGRAGIAAEYRARKHSILKNVQKYCWDSKAGLYREGPDVVQYSQHAQAWAVLNGMLSEEEAKSVLKKTLDDGKVLKCSFSTGYELFKALKQCDMYKETEKLLERWIGLIDLECTTCPEEPENGRSECHAWSALPMYEIVRSVAGIEMKGTNWESVRIRPNLQYVQDISGEAVTPRGKIGFAFDRTRQRGQYRIRLPEGMTGELILSGNEAVQLNSGENKICLSERHI